MQPLQVNANALDSFRASLAAYKAEQRKNPLTTSFPKRYTFSHMGHEAAVDKIYKPFFGDSSVITDMTGETNRLDTHFGIDYVVEVKNPQLRSTVDIWVQERWRTLPSQKYQDITLIEFNNYSGNLAEIYKSKAQVMIYGYLSDDHGVISQAVVVDLAAVMVRIAMGKIPFGLRKNNQVNQTFIHVSIADLRAAGLISYEYNIDS
jgi:hypothetical protein